MAQYQKSYVELLRSFAGRPNFSSELTATAIAAAGFLRTDDTTCRCPICDLELKQSQINTTFLPLRYHLDKSKACHFHTTIQTENGTLKLMADQPAQQLSKDDTDITYCANLDVWAKMDNALSSEKEAGKTRGWLTIVESSPRRAQQAALEDISGDEIAASAQPVIESVSRSDWQSGEPCKRSNMEDWKSMAYCKRIALEMSRDEENENRDTVEDAHGHGHGSVHKHIQLAVVERREATFTTWPNKTPQNPEDFIASGYFYQGNGDSVTCFSCGITSSNWTRQESAFQRHARSSSSCKFLISENGMDAIQEVVEEYGRYNPPTPERSIYVHLAALDVLQL